MRSSRLRLPLLTLACGLAWPLWATTVRVPVATDGSGAPVASSVVIQLVDQAGEPIIGLRATDGAPIADARTLTSPATGTGITVDLVPQEQIAYTAPSYYQFTLSATIARKVIKSSYRVQVPTTGPVHLLDLDAANTPIPPADVLSERLLTTDERAALTAATAPPTATNHLLTVADIVAASGETDPVFTLSAAAGITAERLAQWDTAFSWGAPAAETDPLYSASPAAAISAESIAQWNTAFSWGAPAAETDPLYTASPAAAITAEDIADWSAGHRRLIELGEVTDIAIATADHGAHLTAHLVGDGYLTVAPPPEGSWDTVMWIEAATDGLVLAVLGDIWGRDGSAAIAPSAGAMVEVLLTCIGGTAPRCALSAVGAR